MDLPIARPYRERRGNVSFASERGWILTAYARSFGIFCLLFGTIAESRMYTTTRHLLHEVSGLAHQLTGEAVKPDGAPIPYEARAHEFDFGGSGYTCPESPAKLQSR